MSRIGRRQIKIQPGVKVQVDLRTVAVQGPKGSLTHTLPPGIQAEVTDQALQVRRRDDTKRQKALHGLARALLANAVTGVSKGFGRQLEIHGVGYSAEVKGRVVNFKLGFSHPVTFPIPQGTEIKVERNLISVTGCDRQQVGQVAADIRALRPPDVYKHKGIRYAGEMLRKKAGKAGAK
jgi:large subunit ribosomal protein L6